MKGRTSWSNWAGNQVCAPVSIRKPTNEAELVRIVTEAARTGQRVKCVGAGHSFTPIACTDGVMVDLRGYGRLLAHDPGARTVTVEAGITLEKLCEELDQLGLAMENMGDIGYQSIAGATATATHGTGWHFGNLSSRIVGMRLIAGDGSIVECSVEQNPEVLAAASVGVGALGIVSTITFQAVKAFRLHASRSGSTRCWPTSTGSCRAPTTSSSTGCPTRAGRSRSGTGAPTSRRSRARRSSS
jgi:L-gulonolactone oxidase